MEKKRIMNFYKNFNLSQFIIKLNEKHSIIGKPVLIGSRILFHIRLILSTRCLQYRYRFKYGKLDLNKIYFVSPKRFQFYLRNKLFFRWSNSMRILDGDWDFTKKHYEELISYQTTKDIFKEGKRWDETKLYYFLPDKINNGKKTWTFKNEKARDKWFALTEQLYKRIRKYGYKSQQELYSFKNRLTPKKWSPILDEIATAIDRDGQFLFINGKHRLSIAKVLDIPEIPVVVLIRHKKWLEFRKELIEFSKKSPQKELDFCFTHPDLQDIPSLYDDSCFRIISQNKSVTQGTFLDISPNLGIFCHKFEDIGFKCYAIEEDQSSDYFLKKIKKIENKDFTIISSRFLNNSTNKDLFFDIALKLNFPQLIDERDEDFKKFMKLINNIKVKELFVGFSEFIGSKDKTNDQNFNQEKIVNCIKELSYFNAATLIGKSNNEIIIYKLSS